MFDGLRDFYKRYLCIRRFLVHRFALNNDVYFVQGASRGAIYDLNTGKVHSVSATAAKVLTLARQGLTPLEIATGLPVNIAELVDSLNALVDAGLGHWYAGPPKVWADHRNLGRLELCLRSVTLELTRRCNLQCIHCYAGSGPTALGEELEAEDWGRVVDKVASLGARRLMLTGGEPLLMKDLVSQLIACGQEKGLQLFLATNATLFTDEIIDFLTNYNVAVRTSIYAPDSELHDRITQVRGSFAATIKNILRLRARNVAVHVCMPVMFENQDYILETEQFVRDQLDAKFSTAPILAVGRGCANRLVSTDFSQNASDKLLSVAAERKINVPIRLKPMFSPVYRDLFIRRLHGTCWRNALSITSNGNVTPCIAWRAPVLGNMKESDLDNIVTSDTVRRLWTFTKDKVSVCRDCEYRYACIDCPLQVLLQTGSLYEKPPWCAYDPYTGEWNAGGLTPSSQDRMEKPICADL